ncbi:Testis-specific serine/threonine-protein kinase 2 [Halotydeus destructor]|nr:Testis-specific serine/threonine-protein kinase 2 [Halotydeus destructor]
MDGDDSVDDFAMQLTNDQNATRVAIESAWNWTGSSKEKTIRNVDNDGAVFLEKPTIYVGVNYHSKNGAKVESEALDSQGHQVLSDNGFRIKQQLGGGTFSKVYLADCDDGGSNRDVAIKVITIRRESNKMKFVNRELRASELFDHELVVKTIKTLRTPSFAFIVMEHLINGTISRYLRNKGEPLSNVQAIKWTRQLSTAINYVHRQGWAHRDIKLENIGIDDQFNIKLMDFGFAVESVNPVNGDNIFSFTKCGSLPYVAPETIYAINYNPMAADIWSLGVAAYVMLTRRYPYAGTKDKIGHMRQQQSRQLWMFKRIWDTISADAFHFIHHLLSFDPSKRPTSGQVLEFAWLTETTN